MNEALPLLVENFAPWLTAIGAFIFGIMSHRRSNKTTEHDRFQKTIEELHGLYHNLVADLGEQVERLTEQNDKHGEQNEKLTKVNEELLETVNALREENKGLTGQINSLKRQVTNLRKQVKELDDK